MANAPAQQNESGTDLVLSPKLVEQFREMVTLIPDAEDGGVENIVSMILNAQTPEELEKPWGDNERGIPLGKPFQVYGVRKRPSDFRDGMGFYLEVDAVDLQSGEARTYVTGSVSAVCQIAAAYFNDWLPITFKLVEAEKASKAGYKPQHLEVVQDTAVARKAGKRG